MDERAGAGEWAPEVAPAVDPAVEARCALIFAPVHDALEQITADRTDNAPGAVEDVVSVGAPAAAVEAEGEADRAGLADWAVPGVDRPKAPLVPSAEVLALQAAVAALAQCRPDRLSPDQAIIDLAAVLSVSAQLARVRVDRLADAHDRSLHALDGARSAAAWIRTHGEVAPVEVTVARKLAAYPTLGAALLAGTIPVGTAGTLQTALGKVRPHLDAPDGLLDGADAETAVRNVILHGVRMVVAQARGGFPTSDDPVLQALLAELPAIADLPINQLGRVERAVLLLAQHVEPAQLRHALEMVLDALVPSRLEDAAERAHQRRYLTLTADPDGSGADLRGRLSPLAAERLRLVLDAAMRTDPDNPLDTETAEQLRDQGHDPYDPDLAPTLSPRSMGQRRHDALDTVLTRYLAADLAGSHDKNPVQIVVDLTLPLLTGEPGALPARTSTGTLLPRSIWTSLACGAGFTRHLLDLRGKVIEISHTSRTLKAHERRALHTQTGGTCSGAGCTNSTRQPGLTLHPHHVNPWSRTGTTSLTDTVLPCDRCHAHLHRGHPLRLKDGRLLGPDGWIEG